MKTTSIQVVGQAIFISLQSILLNVDYLCYHGLVDGNPTRTSMSGHVVQRLFLSKKKKKTDSRANVLIAHSELLSIVS